LRCGTSHNRFINLTQSRASPLITMEPITPDSRIKSALRALWLRSKERQAALKMNDRSCKDCGAKHSVAKGREVKVEVHHVEGVLNWQEIYAAVRRNLLCDPMKLETLCKECHKERHR